MEIVMKKRFIAVIAAAALVFASSAGGLSVAVAKAIKLSEEEKALKAEQEKTYISELFHDQGSVYMEPMEPEKDETVTLRLRTNRFNVTRAQIQYTSDAGVTWESSDMEYDGKDPSGYYDMWKGTVKAQGDLMYYRFIASNADGFNTVYYDKKTTDISEGKYSNGWQIVPGHKTPDWAKGAMWYSMLPDAFYNGNTTNDKQTSGNNTYLSWNKLRKGLNDKYGGDLKGIEEKLDYIKSLGTDAIYFNPIQKSYQNAGYGPVRYDEVESSFGNEQDLVSLSDAAHERGLKMMGDVVMTFALADSYYFNRSGNWPVTGAYQSKDSKWFDLFKFFRWPDSFMIGWGSPSVNLNTDTARNLYYAKTDSYLNHCASVFDGYRFDCGGWLWGTSETDDVKTLEFVKEIRGSLKNINKDFLMISESDWSNMNTNSWDAAWNIGYMPKLQDYAKGLINETLILEAMYTYEMTLPRNVALCMQNMISDHDSYRVAVHDDYLYNAAMLIQMTYLGAPSVFYGEEVGYINENEEGIGTNQSFYSMDWDESNWDQSRLAFYRATSELRKAYSCVKTGVVKILGSDISANTLSFARWDKNGAAITVTSQNEDVTEIEVNARECSIKDGTVLTDWYTGETYTVKDGKVKANVIPGGTVLVTGKKASSYRCGYSLDKIGNASGKNSITARDIMSFDLKGKGKLDGKKDTLTFASTQIFDGFSVYAGIKGGKNAALMIRNSENPDSMCYAAEVDGNKLIIKARTSDGGKIEKIAETKCSGSTYVKLVRNADNSFAAFTANVNDGQLESFKEVKDSLTYIPMNSKVYYGFAPLKGEMKINNITVESANDRITYDNFDGKAPVSLFDGISEKNIKTDGGKLVLSPAGKEDNTFLLTRSSDGDWTFKSEIEYTPDGESYAGIVSKQDDNNFTVAGRKLIDGKTVLFIGKYTNGELAVYDFLDDPSDGGKITLQLQRIGAVYSAVYSVDGGKTWGFIGKLFANYALEQVGLMINGKKPLTAYYVSFGDSINDGISVSTPYSPTEIDTSYNNEETAYEAAYELVSGDWSMITGGWHQNDGNVLAIAAVKNNEYSDFYAEATFNVEGDGWLGIGFGLKDSKSGADNGFRLKYYKGGRLLLTKNGKTVAEGSASPEKNGDLRIVLEAADGKIRVYAGQNPKIAITADSTGYQKGYVAFYSENAKGDVKNFHIGHTVANWLWTSGNGSGSRYAITANNVNDSGRQIHTIATLTGYAFTDMVCSMKLSCVPAGEDGDAVAGVLLAAGEGKSAHEDGVLIGINRDKKIFLSVNGSQKGDYPIADGKSSALILIVKQAGEYKVFLEGVNDPILTYSEKANRGGVLSLYSYNAQGNYINAAVENLQPGQSYLESKLASNWNKSLKSKYSDSFDNESSNQNYNYYNNTVADFSVKNGALVCENSAGWEAGATVMADTYSDFTMDFKLKINSSQGGWMSVGLRKNSPSGNHNNSGVSVMINGGGGMFFFDSSEQKQYSNTQYTGFKMNQWYDVRIAAAGKTITLYMNGQKMMTYTDTKYFDGFISFTSGMTNFEIDDLRITPNN